MALTNKQRVTAATAMAAALAAPAEGLRRVAYYDPPGILTACRGHTGGDVKANVVYSMEQCDRWFSDDMRKAIAIVDKCQPGLPVPILAAFGDAVFNMGSTIACNRAASTAARKLDAKDYRGACLQLPRWDKARILGVMVALPGLTTRRARERDVCMQAVA